MRAGIPPLAITLVCATAVFAVDLTTENLASLTAGKTTFVKFYAPWCGHCRAMKPSWDTLMQEYQEDQHVLIGDCDCTGDCRTVCEQMGVQGYPTLKFGELAALEDYTGGRDLENLRKHAQTLKPLCSLDNMHLCDDEQRRNFELLLALSAEDLDAQVEKIEGELAALESEYKAAVERLRLEYYRLEDEHAAVVRPKTTGLASMKAIQAANAKTEQEL
jgi:protein disulfide-isomerase-like protein